jgi:hypothetical protein
VQTKLPGDSDWEVLELASCGGRGMRTSVFGVSSSTGVDFSGVGRQIPLDGVVSSSDSVSRMDDQSELTEDK